MIISQKRNIIFYFSWPFKWCTCRSSSSDITNYPFHLIDKIPCSASLKQIFDEIHSLAQDLHGLVWSSFLATRYFPPALSWSIHRSLVPIVFVLAHCFSPRPANTSQSMLQNRCQYFFCSTCIFYLLLFPEKFRSTYISWFELHIENDGFHDYHALLSNLRSLSIRIRLRSLQGNKHGVNSVSCVAWSPT